MAPLSRIAAGLGALIIGAAVMIGLALVYFVITAWIVTFGVRTVTGETPSADWVAIAASLLTMGGLLGSTYRAVASMTPRPAVARDDYEGQEVM